MSWAILGLMAGFILVLSILFYLLLRSKLHAALKFMAVFMVTAFYWIQYESLQQFTGWPSTDDLPQEFVLIASDVLEPNKQTGHPGIMYWWVKNNTNLQQPPRVFQLSFDSEMHKEIQNIIEEQKKGSLYVGRKKETSLSDSGLGVSFEKISKAERHKKE